MGILESLYKRKKLLAGKFLNSLSNEEYITPVEVAELMIKKFPPEIWKNPNVSFNCSCSKSGIFPLQMIINFMENLSIQDETLRYNHIINNMVKVSVSHKRNKWIVSKMIYGDVNEAHRIGILPIDKIKKSENIILPMADLISGNPPYLKDFHLKLLKISCDSLNEGGEIIWIHPARWLQDPLAPMKGNSDFNKYKDLPFVNFEIIPCGIASKLFNNEMTSDLVISHLKKGEKSILTEDKIYELRGIPIHFKELLKSKFFSLKDVIEKDKRKGIRVRIRAIVPNTVHGRDHVKGRYDLLTKADKVIIDGIMDGQDWTKGPARNQFTKKEGSPLPLSIKFDTVQEAQNFIDSINTEFFLFFNYLTKLDVNVQFQYLPFMKDYREPWTNERFQRYFQVSDEEMKFIKDTMKKYK